MKLRPWPFPETRKVLMKYLPKFAGLLVVMVTAIWAWLTMWALVLPVLWGTPAQVTAHHVVAMLCILITRAIEDWLRKKK
jgi:hypothetical protein